MKTKLDRYVGSLDPVGVAAGINAARENSNRLATDARTLFEAGRYPSAAGLATLSIEESGKTSILRALVLADNVEEVRDAWKRYRSHTSKNAMWLLPSLVAHGARRLADFAPLYARDSGHTFLLDQVKQISLYSDCLGQAHWSRPTKVIDQSLASTLVQTAEILSKGSEVTVREIELWVKHMKPVWKATPNWRNKALANWYAAMQAEGLAPPGENQMNMFIFKGLGHEQKEDS